MKKRSESFPYEDIINLPHHRSKTRPHMSLSERAAQFSPFAALTGYEDELKEAARLTNTRPQLSEDVKEALAERLNCLYQNQGSHPGAVLTYFVPDERKDGGAYVTETVTVRRIDTVRRILATDDQREIPLDDIVEVSLIPGDFSRDRV